MSRWLSSFLSLLFLLISFLGTSNAIGMECFDPPGNLNNTGDTDVVDVQCLIVVTLNLQAGMPGPLPDCLAEYEGEANAACADTNCDDSVDVTDIAIEIYRALGTPLSELLDADPPGGDGIVDACQALVHCAGDVVVTDAEKLATLAGCEVIDGYLMITGSNLTDLSDLSSLISVEGYLSISLNNAITDLDGLSNLTSVGDWFSVEFNDSLTQVDSLSSLTSVGGDFLIEWNGALTSISGLSGLTSVGGPLYIHMNSVLTNLDGLSNLTSVEGTVDIADNAINDVDGLSGLSWVGGDFHVYDNEALTDVDGLSSLSSVGGVLHIWENDALTNLDGLSSLTSVGGIQICCNASLCQSLVEAFIEALGEGLMGSTGTNTNADC